MRIHIFILLIALSWEILAQHSVADFLFADIRDIELDALTQKQKFYEQNAFTSPVLSEIEFRARARRAEINPEIYRLRFGFNNPGEVSASKALASSLGGQLALTQKIRMNDIMMERYQLLIEHMYYSRYMAIIRRALQNNMDMRELSMTAPQSQLLDTWLATQQELNKLELEIRSASYKAQLINEIISSRAGKNLQINWIDFDIIMPEQMSTMRQRQHQKHQLDVAALENEYQIAQDKLRLEKASQFSNIGFIQTEYNEARGNQSIERFGLQIGVKLPIINKDRADLSRMKMNLIGTEFEVMQRKLELDEASRQNQLSFEYYLSRAEWIGSSLNELMEIRGKQLHEKTDLDWILKSNKFAIELEIEYLDAYMMLLVLFIEQLHRDGQLAHEPLLNYLSATELKVK